MSIQGVKTVLISEPYVTASGLPYLPLVWGLLKTHWEQHGGPPESTQWLSPIFQSAKVLPFLENYQGQKIDVLGLSCYIWNWDLQCQLAKEVKTHNPDCLIVAGGPEVDYKNPNLFKLHPYLDVVVVRDGEITFTHLLKKVLEHGNRLIENRSLLTEVPGLYLPGLQGKPSINTGPPDLPSDFSHSPYIAQQEHYEAICQSLDSHIFATMETNRGCPYKCTFCDWGSATNSKIRQFNMDRIKAEFEWFGRMKIRSVFLADANFGILPRDVEISKFFSQTKERLGYPQYLAINSAKNNPDRTLEISEVLFKNDLITDYALSIQHTNETVLAHTDRRSISLEKQCEVAKNLIQTGYPIYVQLILGLPGDTIETWKACFSDLMEWDIHAHYWNFLYHLLPNAPASAPQYMEKWEIETIERYVIYKHGGYKRGSLKSLNATKAQLIVSTRSYSKEDWVQMNLDAAFVKAFCNYGVVQSIAKYLRFTHAVPYSKFCDELFESFFTQNRLTRPWFQAIECHYQNYLQNEEGTDYMETPELRSFEFLTEPSRWLYFQICFHLNEFFDELKPHLLAHYPTISNLESLIDYQKELVVLPSYNRSEGKSFENQYDWYGYFNQQRDPRSEQVLPEPERFSGNQMQVVDQSWVDGTHPFDWDLVEGEQRWIQWFHQMVFVRNSAEVNNFQKIQYG